jgi:flagellin
MGISLGSIRSLRGAQSASAQSSTRLASRLRINSAADDAAGLAVADGIELAQSAQGGLSEISNLLSEARVLSVQSSPGSLLGQTRSQLDSQFQATLSDIDAIAATIGFGSFNPLSDDTLQIALASARPTRICRSCSACSGNHKNPRRDAAFERLLSGRKRRHAVELGRSQSSAQLRPGPPDPPMPSGARGPNRWL